MLFVINNTFNTEWKQLASSYTQNWITHEVQLYTLCTSQQSTKLYHSLVMVGPDTLLTYFTVF